MPLLGTLVISLGGKFWPGKVPGWIGTLAIAAAFVFAVITAIKLGDLPEEHRVATSALWDLANVDGVRIRFYANEHPPPHFHARIAEFIAQVRIDPVEILIGSLPPNKVDAVLDWAILHREALMKAWNDLEEGRKPGKIT